MLRREHLLEGPLLIVSLDDRHALALELFLASLAEEDPEFPLALREHLLPHLPRQPQTPGELLELVAQAEEPLPPWAAEIVELQEGDELHPLRARVVRNALLTKEFLNRLDACALYFGLPRSFGMVKQVLAYLDKCHELVPERPWKVELRGPEPDLPPLSVRAITDDWKQTIEFDDWKPHLETIEEATARVRSEVERQLTAWRSTAREAAYSQRHSSLEGFASDELDGIRWLAKKQAGGSYRQIARVVKVRPNTVLDRVRCAASLVGLHRSRIRRSKPGRPAGRS